MVVSRDVSYNITIWRVYQHHYCWYPSPSFEFLPKNIYGSALRTVSASAMVVNTLPKVSTVSSKLPMTGHHHALSAPGGLLTSNVGHFSLGRGSPSRRANSIPKTVHNECHPKLHRHGHPKRRTISCDEAVNLMNKTGIPCTRTRSSHLYPVQFDTQPLTMIYTILPNTIFQ